MDHACHRIQVFHIRQEFQSPGDQDAHSVAGDGLGGPGHSGSFWRGDAGASADCAVCGEGLLRAVTDLYLELARLGSTYQSLGS